jgi:hypothetical protein
MALEMMDDQDDPAETTYDGPILCQCGDVLVDRIDGVNVVIDGVELQFRRWSDEMICRGCGSTHTMGVLRAVAEQPVDIGYRQRRSDRTE